METTTTPVTSQMAREIMEQALRALTDVRSITDKAAALDRWRLAEADASADPEAALARSATDLGIYELWDLLDTTAGAIAGHLGHDSDPIPSQDIRERVSVAQTTLALIGGDAPSAN